MRLTNEVVLPAAPETVFALINDVSRVAPCMPGATLEGRTGDDSYRGRVRVKVGPISAAYQGVVRFLEVDEPGNRLVLDAKGSDQHGSGNAEAKVEVRVRPHDDGSVLALDTDLVIRGKVAQFGRGALATVSQQLMEQFARNISELLAEPVVSGNGRQDDHNHSRPELDGLSLVAVPVLKKIAPVAAALAVGIVAGRLLGARRRDVLADDRVNAVVQIGSESFSVPARRVVTLLRR
ncbi:SRPBCC family protein [Saccharopolyspora sp. K220]|uniref:SRPBCC family protein n=1 Tax=Saccharopolyspora soli TaxID=2926618 RepID=UPI001F575D6C|nr:SRPBCC family protein [Saccharopolyspora soli]MCI2420809.1 SRPBCC family protein [Saccharopolyspora soli]